ncbi:MAG: spore coat protein GerQ [Erysipelotrichaceae bacterium]|nr:spore coat protein GerQ [Erysipelotrichaceae bacterium]
MDYNQNNQYPYAIPYGQGTTTQMPLPPAQTQPQTPPQGQNYYPPMNQQPQYTQPQPKRVTEEDSYIENIIRLNRGKMATFYMSYGDSNEWKDRVYKGIIEAAGVDHIIISDPKDGRRYILLNVYLDWVEFNEEINYIYPYK